MKPLTPDEYFAMNISGRMDALEAKIDAVTYRVRVDIGLQLLEVGMMLEEIEAWHRNLPRVVLQKGGRN
jgi:hypothetical protein